MYGTSKYDHKDDTVSMQGIGDAWSLTKDTEAKTKLLIFCN